MSARVDGLWCVEGVEGTLSCVGNVKCVTSKDVVKKKVQCVTTHRVHLTFRLSALGFIVFCGGLTPWRHVLKRRREKKFGSQDDGLCAFLCTEARFFVVRERDASLSRQDPQKNIKP